MEWKDVAAAAAAAQWRVAADIRELRCGEQRGGRLAAAAQWCACCVGSVWGERWEEGQRQLVCAASLMRAEWLERWGTVFSENFRCVRSECVPRVAEESRKLDAVMHRGQAVQVLGLRRQRRLVQAGMHRRLRT